MICDSILKEMSLLVVVHHFTTVCWPDFTDFTAVSPTSPMPVSVFEPEDDRYLSNGADGEGSAPPPPPPFFHEGSAESAVGDPLRHAVLRNNVASAICKHLKVFFQAGRIASKVVPLVALLSYKAANPYLCSPPLIFREMKLIVLRRTSSTARGS